MKQLWSKGFGKEMSSSNFKTLDGTLDGSCLFFCVQQL